MAVYRTSKFDKYRNVCEINIGSFPINLNLMALVRQRACY